MKLFYKPTTKHLIAVPLRNGSSHLYKNMGNYELIETTYKPFFDTIIDEVKLKTFIYRDPCLRLMSFYENFVYKPYLEKDKPKDKKYQDMFTPLTRGQTLLSDLVLATHKIKKNYQQDLHTRPQ